MNSILKKTLKEKPRKIVELPEVAPGAHKSFGETLQEIVKGGVYKIPKKRQCHR